MRTTLRDVARLAGVSPKTVSNVVNGYIHVRPETRRRVQHAIARLNYRPNLSARSLRRGRTGVIALAVPELDVPYFAELARHLVAEAERYGWTVLVDQTEGEPDRERQILDGLRGQLIDGLIFSPLALTAADLAKRTDATPLVLLGERIHQGPADHVVIDNVAASRAATEHLIGLGRRRIAAIGAQLAPAGVTARLRLRGYREALEAAGLPYDENLVASTTYFHRADGAAAMARLLDRTPRPDAVFCFNDLLALGALRTLADHGVRVPDDIAVIGFDDIEDGQYSVPTLSTVSPDKRQIARLAVDLLNQQLVSGAAGQADGRGPQEVFATFELVARESTLGRER
ncbi:LacI family DNA-binding transcriptional regulator [Thermasporomyces composti]|jgi:DNA-binding LacI/PurR family transcriptional regulator|uniref:LacI family transcriptional regulator n=1 Tax=Thermasporomyces composti TaxID=696763 RepID=A0A3D9V4D7_THECX|nr:LacI family DNA-binding transcriptional regulator [Thermasporomyces composti]REF35060.1 LacI family transcriptional regulator [Thermasporomyces composti]